MSGVVKGIGKIFKKVGKIAKKVAPIALAAGAAFLTGGAMSAALGGASTALSGVASSVVGKATGGISSNILGMVLQKNEEKKREKQRQKRLDEDRKRLEDSYGGGLDVLNTKARADTLKSSPKSSNPVNSTANEENQFMMPPKPSNIAQTKPKTEMKKANVTQGLMQAASLPDATGLSMSAYPNQVANHTRIPVNQLLNQPLSQPYEAGRYQLGQQQDPHNILTNTKLRSGISKYLPIG